MTKILRFSLCALAAFSVTSCANWLTRQDCKKINWYQHGYDAAMSGRRLTGDPDVDKCRKAEYDLPEQELDVGFKAGMANYCKPEIVVAVGRKGDFFNTELCDPGQARFLMSKHAEGVKAYCQDGYGAGSSGKKYQNICPANLEVAFLKDYKKGRKAYLTARVNTASGSVRDIDGELTNLERERANLSFQRNMLPPPREIRERVYNASTGMYTDQSRTDDPSASRRSQIESEINSVGSRITDAQQRQRALRDQISADQLELATLE